MKRRREEDSSSYKNYKLFLDEDWFEVVRVNCGVASISLFRIDVPLSSKSVQFGTKMTRMEPNNKVELREILGLPHLPLSQHLSSRKVLKIFIIHNNINGIGQTF